MNTGKVIVLAAFTGAVIALFTTDKGKKIRKDIADTAEDWSDTLTDLLDKASCSIKDLQKIMSKEIAGLAEDTRQRIMAIIEESMAGGKKTGKVPDARLN
jgi:gas vesicle protein